MMFSGLSFLANAQNSQCGVFSCQNFSNPLLKNVSSSVFTSNDMLVLESFSHSVQELLDSSSEAIKALADAEVQIQSLTISLQQEKIYKKRWKTFGLISISITASLTASLLLMTMINQ